MPCRHFYVIPFAFHFPTIISMPEAATANETDNAHCPYPSTWAIKYSVIVIAIARYSFFLKYADSSLLTERFLLSHPFEKSKSPPNIDIIAMETHGCASQCLTSQKAPANILVDAK